MAFVAEAVNLRQHPDQKRCQGRSDAGDRAQSIGGMLALVEDFDLLLQLRDVALEHSEQLDFLTDLELQ